MYTVIANYENGEVWRNTYIDLDVAIAVMYEVTEFGGDGCVMENENGTLVVVTDPNFEL